MAKKSEGRPEKQAEDDPGKKPQQHRNIPKLNITADEKTREGLRAIIEATGCRSQSAAVAVAVAEWVERRAKKK